MKKMLLWLLSAVVLSFKLVLILLPCLSVLFVIGLITAAVMIWGFGITAALPYLVIGAIIYAGLGLFTFAFLTFDAFQECCAWHLSFVSHLKHYGWWKTCQDAIEAIIWPLSWINIDRHCRTFTRMYFYEAVTDMLLASFISVGLYVTEIYVKIKKLAVR